ncbi:anthranilate synthase component 1 [Phytophthora cinnamomi]|uniref:anthranilate synthase component 1 n=1 Tax=Phytophthora cinnamomi TaxID=4785 RepID=UPI003559EBDF|nr:anthranilate synthase component 1 [Phytophthora cinnamomi]
MAESLRTQLADRPRVHDMNTLGLPKDPPPLGAQLYKTKRPNFVHGTPIQRRLVAGKLIRMNDLEECMLNSSASAPELSRAIARQIKGLKEYPESEQDTLDLAMNCAAKATCREEQKATQPLPKRELDPAEQERIALRQQENQLQAKLLYVTQKLTRKYKQQLAPRSKGPAATCKIHSLAQKWEEQHQGPEHASSVSASVDNDRYNLYAAGRFSTQTEIDYYPRKIEPREPATDKHRRHTTHTKYGNALAKNKCSLRGPF